jgi:hypothetical protein
MRAVYERSDQSAASVEGVARRALKPAAVQVHDIAAQTGVMGEDLLAGCGKSRDFGKTVMKRARNGNPDLIKSMSYEGEKGDELGWEHTDRLFPQHARARDGTSRRSLGSHRKTSLHRRPGRYICRSSSDAPSPVLIFRIVDGGVFHLVGGDQTVSLAECKAARGDGRCIIDLVASFEW